MKLELKSLELKDFKGCREAKFDFTQLTTISGENGSGKSTIADAWYWLWCDCDSRMTKNPMIRPVGVEESLPTVTATITIDGTKHTFTKRQEAKQSSGKGNAPISNKYEFNSVPVTERDLWKKLNDMGIYKDDFLALSHPNSFTSSKAAEMRKVLFDMTSDHTDIEIAGKAEETLLLVPLLEQYSVEEILAMNKATLKAAKERVASIPDIIVGMERSKAEGSISALEAEKEAVTAERDALNIPNKADLSDEYNKKMNAIRAIEQDISERKWKASREARKKLDDVSRDFDRLKFEISTGERDISNQEAVAKNLMRNMEDCRTNSNDLKTAYEEEKEEKCPYIYTEPKPLKESDLVCPTCGQKLTMMLRDKAIKRHEAEVKEAKEDFDQRVAAWESEKKHRLEKYRERSRDYVAKFNDAKIRLKTVSAEIQRLKTEVGEKKKLVSDYELKVKKQTDELLTTDEYHDIEEARVAELREEAAAIKAQMVEADKLREKFYEYHDRINAIDRNIAVLRHNDEIDAKIDSLNAELLENEQAKANAEKVIDAVSALSRNKNELLTEEINKHFKIVQFSLFEYQKNGEYKDTCIPKIDGKAFGESLNTGRELQGKLDICEGLQKYYDTYLPIFLDNAESLNDWNVPKIDTQLVLLKVSEDKKLVVS